MSKRDPKSPFVPAWVPSEPFQVSVGSDGKPVWADPLDFAETPDVKQERSKNLKAAQAEGAKQDVERKVYQAAQAWLESRLVKLMPAQAFAAVKHSDFNVGIAWLRENGFSYHVENTGDEYKVILMHRGSEISRFVARRRDFKK